MSEKDTEVQVGDDEETIYKPPPEKSLTEIIEADKEDESLQKYKKTLLGQATTDRVVVEPDNPSRVIVKRLALLVDGRPDVVLDLSPGMSHVSYMMSAISSKSITPLHLR